MSEPINLLRKTVDGPKITGSDAGRTWHWAVPRIGMLFDELETAEERVIQLTRELKDAKAASEHNRVEAESLRDQRRELIRKYKDARADWKTALGQRDEANARAKAHIRIFEDYRTAMSGYAKGALTEAVARKAKAELENALAALPEVAP